jgi:hypothetical protein
MLPSAELFFGLKHEEDVGRVALGFTTAFRFRIRRRWQSAAARALQHALREDGPKESMV